MDKDNHGPIQKVPAISFCVTCRNRLWQLRQTLGKNLSALEEDMQICIVDYGSSDGLSNWLWNNFKGFMDAQTIIFFEVKNPVSWNSPTAKNLAHRISSGNYLFNLDADNFVCTFDIDHIRQAATVNLPCWQYSKILNDGSYGRIGIPREIFFNLGGYDEGMLAMGGQDFDLMHRFSALNIKVLHLPPPAIPAIDNTISQKVAEVHTIKSDAQITYNLMNNFNVKRSQFRLDLEGPSLQGGFTSFKGLLNGRLVLIDGFNNIYYL